MYRLNAFHLGPLGTDPPHSPRSSRDGPITAHLGLSGHALELHSCWMHTHRHTHTHVHTHAHVRTCTPTCTHAHAHTHPAGSVPREPWPGRGGPVSVAACPALAAPAPCVFSTLQLGRPRVSPRCHPYGYLPSVSGHQSVRPGAQPRGSGPRGTREGLSTAEHSHCPLPHRLPVGTVPHRGEPAPERQQRAPDRSALLSAPVAGTESHTPPRPSSTGRTLGDSPGRTQPAAPARQCQRQRAGHGCRPHAPCVPTPPPQFSLPADLIGASQARPPRPSLRYWCDRN